MHSASRNLITHDKITEAMTKLGYESVKEGVCNGLAQMWAQAVFCHETDKFLNRLQLICNTPDLPAQIATTQHKRGKGLTENDHNYLDIMAFFDGVQLYQNFRLYTHLLMPQPHHLDASAISTLTLPLKLEKNPIIEIASENSLANTVNLQSHLNKLAGEFAVYTRHCNTFGKTTQRPPELVITVHACTHKIALRYKHASLNWELADANQYPPFNLPLHGAAPAILHSLTEGDLTPINISILTTANNPLKNTAQVAFEKIKMDIPINRLTARSLSSKKNHLLILAAMRGDEKKFTEITNKIPNPQLWEYMIPAAKTALFHGQTQIIHAILKQHPDCLMRADDAQEYLSLAITNRQNELITNLLTLGADANEPYKQQRPLHIAIEADNLSAAKKLITLGADINLANLNHEPPLFYAIKLRRMEIIHYLLSLPKIDAGITSMLGDTALMTAIRENSGTTCKLLLAKKVDLHTKNNNGETPLFMAILKQYWDIAAMILMNMTSLTSLNAFSYAHTIHQLGKLLPHLTEQLNELSDEDKHKFKLDIKHHRNALGLMLMKKPKADYCRFFKPNEKQRKIYKQRILSACDPTSATDNHSTTLYIRI